MRKGEPNVMGACDGLGGTLVEQVQWIRSRSFVVVIILRMVVCTHLQRIKILLQKSATITNHAFLTSL